MALTDLATVKTFLGISGTTEDTKLAAIITYVDALIKNTIGQNVEQATYTDELYDLENNGRIVVNQRPLNSVTSVYVDLNRVFGASTLVAATDYYIDSAREGSIRLIPFSGLRITARPADRLSGIQSKYRKVVKVTYSAGYLASQILDLTGAANMLVGAWRLVGPWGGGVLTSESLKIYSYSLGKVVGLAENERSKYAGLANIMGTIQLYKGLNLRIY